jgi:hypothetical protein
MTEEQLALLDERIIRQQTEIERLRAQVEKLTNEREHYRITLLAKVMSQLLEHNRISGPDARNWAIIFAGGIEDVADEALCRCHRAAEQMAKDG